MLERSEPSGPTRATGRDQHLRGKGYLLARNPYYIPDLQRQSRVCCAVLALGLRRVRRMSRFDVDYVRHPVEGLRAICRHQRCRRPREVQAREPFIVSAEIHAIPVSLGLLRLHDDAVDCGVEIVSPDTLGVRRNTPFDQPSRVMQEDFEDVDRSVVLGPLKVVEFPRRVIV